MILRGWYISVPEYLEKAIQEGRITIHYNQKHDVDYLDGETKRPDGVVVSFTSVPPPWFEGPVHRIIAGRPTKLSISVEEK